MRLLPLGFALCVSFVSLLPAQDGKASTGSTPPSSTPPSSGQANSGQPADAAAKKATPTGLVVGVVDLGKAFDLYPRTIKERGRLQQIAKSFDEQMKEIERRADELKATIQGAKEGSREQKQKILEYELTLQQKRAQAQLFDEELQAERSRMQLAIYEDLDGAVKQLAKERGLTLVLRIDVDEKDPADKQDQKQRNSRLRAFDARSVLFAADELDLTQPLIKMLQTYDPTKDAAPAPGGGSTPGTGKDSK